MNTYFLSLLSIYVCRCVYVCVCKKHSYQIMNYTCINIFIFDPICIYSDLSFHVLCVLPWSSFRTEAQIFSHDRRIGRLRSSLETLLGKYTQSERAGLRKSHLFSFHTRPLRGTHSQQECEGPAHHASSGGFCRATQPQSSPQGLLRPFLWPHVCSISELIPLLPFQCLPSWVPPLPA